MAGVILRVFIATCLLVMRYSLPPLLSLSLRSVGGFRSKRSSSKGFFQFLGLSGGDGGLMLGPRGPPGVRGPPTPPTPPNVGARTERVVPSFATSHHAVALEISPGTIARPPSVNSVARCSSEEIGR